MSRKKRAVGKPCRLEIFFHDLKNEMNIKDFAESKELFRIITEHIDDLIAVLDLTGKRLYNSPSYKSLFGDANLKGTDSFREVHPDDRIKIKEIFTNTVKTGIGQRTEYRLVLPDGSVRFIESQGNVIKDDKGKPQVVVVVSRDITERRQSESKIRLLAHALSCTKDFFCLTDLNNNILFVNNAFCEAYGYKEDELIGKSIISTLSSKNPHHVLKEILPATLAGGWNGDIIALKKNGAEFPVEMWTSVVNGEDNTPVALVSVVRDISDRQKAMTLLQEGEQRFRSLIENSSDGVAMLASDGTPLYISASTTKILGYKEEELLGKNPFAFVHPDDRSASEESFKSVLESSSKKVEGLYRVLHKDGSWRWVETVSTNLLHDPGVHAVVTNFRDITDRKNAEERLRENEAKYRLLFESNPEAMWVFDLQTLRFLAVNDAAIVRYGYSYAEFMEMTILDIRPASEIPKLKERLQQPQQGLQTFLGVRHQKKNGEIIDVEVLVHPIDFTGKTANLVIAKDITVRSRSEKLQEAVYRISQAADKAPDLDRLFKDIHEIISTVMPAGNFYIALYDEKEGMISFPYFVDEVDVPSPPQKLGRGMTEYVLRTGKSLLCDQALDEELQRRGEVEMVGVSSPIWLGVPLIIDNKPIGVMTVQHYSDPHAYGHAELQMLEFVSSQVAKAIDKKRSEEALRKSEERYRNLFEQIPTGIYRTTPDGKIIMANPTLINMLGYSSFKELSSMDLEREGFEHQHHRKMFKELVEREGEVKGLEGSWLKKDKSIIFVRENARAILGKDGLVAYYEGTVEDITERKRLEQQLQQAQKMEGIGTLAGGIAHDFNNLLGIILGYTQLLEAGNVSPERYAKSLDTIKKAVERGAELVRQLLTFARKADPSFHSVNVNDSIKDLSRMLSETFPKSITIALELGENLPSIFADATQLHQALLNLCVNARDAMVDPKLTSGQGGTLSLRTDTIAGYKLQQKFPNATSNEYVSVVVADTGIGMDEQTKKRIFEPFFTTKELGKGTGLGLAVVYGVINSHHAFADFESEKGKGTTFILYFPATPRQDAVPVEEITASVPAGKEHETVLLVEDEEMLLDLLAGLLQSQGYNVLTAKDGQEGLEIFTAHANEISLVLSDMGLPRLGGWEMFQKMKEVNPNVRAILASGYFDPNVKMDLLKAGAKDFIQKPYVPDQILIRIREVIDEGTPAEKKNS